MSVEAFDVLISKCRGKLGRNNYSCMHAAISYGITHVVRKLFRYEKDFLSSNEETTLMHLIRCDLEQEENENHDEMI